MNQIMSSRALMIQRKEIALATGLVMISALAAIVRDYFSRKKPQKAQMKPKLSRPSN
ncbi:MAG TPA: hypothetical protein VN659_06550 [Pyrinomonadaceae bacterium]|nr:hypothetical protein [Pyrinomonadaceae bacterium]